MKGQGSRVSVEVNLNKTSCFEIGIELKKKKTILQFVLKITKRSILTLRPAIRNDQLLRHCVQMKCFIVAKLKRNL